VAAAILENARGDVVGEKTFGEGSLPKTFDLPDGGALILSVAKYYSPSGKAIQETAVTPNVLVADDTDNEIVDDEDGAHEPDVKTKEQESTPKVTPDDQLHKAIEVLKLRTS
jgi:carboxyl-terminal processing protease